MVLNMARGKPAKTTVLHTSFLAQWADQVVAGLRALGLRAHARQVSTPIGIDPYVEHTWEVCVVHVHPHELAAARRALPHVIGG